MTTRGSKSNTVEKSGITGACTASNLEKPRGKMRTNPGAG